MPRIQTHGRPFAAVALMCLVATFIMLSLIACGTSQGQSDPATPTTPAASSTDARFDFQSTTIQGEKVALSDYSDARVILVNMWEPCCGPCVGEMPDLERLYETYQDQGFLIIGAYSTVSQKDDALAIMAQCGTTYPVVYENDDFNAFKSGYVPTSFIVDGQGNVLSDLIVGSHSYEDWEKIITPYLQGN